VRRWPLERYAQIAERLRVEGWQVSVIDENHGDLASLFATLAPVSPYALLFSVGPRLEDLPNV
jgi:ADP-heptose:LPS heptosyltransferase